MYGLNTAAQTQKLMIGPYSPRQSKTFDLFDIFLVVCEHWVRWRQCLQDWGQSPKV